MFRSRWGDAMDTLPTQLIVSLIGGPLDGDDALMLPPLPLHQLFRSGWDSEQERRKYRYALHIDGLGKPSYIWERHSGRKE